MTDWVLLVGAIALGACIGSYLNVLIHRLPARVLSDRPVHFPARSFCPACGKPIPAWLNVPVFAWLLLRGRAACCGARIPFRYPLVEALTATMYGLVFAVPPSGLHLVRAEWDWEAALAFGLHAYFLGNLIANTFIDLDHRILPDRLTLSACAVGILGSLFVPGIAGSLGTPLPPASDSLLTAIVGAVAGAGSTAGIRWLGTVAFRRQAMGLGDVKLMAAIGAFTGWQGVLVTLFAGSLLGALVGTWHRLRTGEAEIYFGPFLAVGAVVALFLRVPLLRFLLEDLPEWQRSSPAAPWILLVTAGLCLVALFVLLRRGRAT
ncbi:MAG: prepilin peptidase [Planctomycetes bacterium]|nr:prepilin peptidase [Planctomycetota bacterium]